MNTYVTERFSRERFVELRDEAAGELQLKLAREANGSDPLPPDPPRESWFHAGDRAVRRARQIIAAYQVRRVGIR